ncbi:MAG TPA: carbamoyltransferase [Sandaracinaceae bacterium LLY-WYZ-13_1]|nr:carbamoyltransferase [Sandaracinaceae bacterium LLY-WYZ-13_1]
MRILGISCWYHDSAACLIDDGVIVAAAQEERFTRRKHDDAFPSQAVRYCLAEAGSRPVDAVAFYDKPILKLHRILETSLGVAPKGLRPFLTALPVWLKDKLWIEPKVLDALRDEGVEGEPTLYFPEHHHSHAASAFYPSPFERAAVLTLDGVGEWATATIGVGRGRSLELVEELDFPHSLGLLYSAFTYFTGFRVNSGEYKLMGLAPYGEPVHVDAIREHLLDLKEDGSFRLNMDYFGYLDDVVMTNARFASLFGGPARRPEDRITKREMDLARSIQEVTEEIVLRIARHARLRTGEAQLCMAGGVALNCVANGRLLRAGIFDELWIQPAAGDAGGAVGAAYATWHGPFDGARPIDGGDRMQGAYLGPEFASAQIRAWLDARGYPYEAFEDDGAWAAHVAGLLADEKVVGLFQGRMEFGPRALGNRSIVGDPRSPKMQSVMNLKIKQRESFRPFAPSVLEERVEDFFELDRPSPYMLLVAPVQPSRRREVEGREDAADLIAWVNQVRSDVPAITHVDFSARVQTVSRETNPRYHALIEAFEARTGYGIVVNTSFNVRGEPIVCTPEDAYRCFMATEMDALSLGPFVLRAEDQPGYDDRAAFAREFAPD